MRHIKKDSTQDSIKNTLETIEDTIDILETLQLELEEDIRIAKYLKTNISISSLEHSVKHIKLDIIKLRKNL